MSNWKMSVGVLAIGAAGFVAGRSLPTGGGAMAAQPDKKAPATPAKGQPDNKAKPGMMMEPPGPGEEHKRLEPLIGEFEGTAKMWMDPASEPFSSKGTIKREWGLDGMFVLEHVTGDPMMPGGKPFTGMGAMGYNTIEKRYESVWIENMSSPIQMYTGTLDAAKKTMTLTGECYDPMSGKKMKTRSIADFSDPDKEVMTSYMTGPDGKEFKSFEGTFTRKASSKK